MTSSQDTIKKKEDKKYTVREVLDSLYYEYVDEDEDFDGFVHLTSVIDGRGTKVDIRPLIQRVQRETIAEVEKEFDLFYDEDREEELIIYPANWLAIKEKLEIPKYKTEMNQVCIYCRQYPHKKDCPVLNYGKTDPDDRR